jgi:hypothetical protein
MMRILIPSLRKLHILRSIPLFAKRALHPFVSRKDSNAVVRSGGPGRSKDRRFCALPWTGASTMGRLAIVRRKLFVCVAILALAIAFGAPQSTDAKTRTRKAEVTSIYRDIAGFIAEAAARFNIPAAWIRAVMSVESAGDLHAISPKGAMGLMQIMPKTYAVLRANYGLGSNPYNPHDNILAGAAYLREMHDRYGSSGFLAAYNAGPDRYEDHLTTGRPLPAETRDYVVKVGTKLGLHHEERVPRIKLAAIDETPWSQGPLFFVQEIIDQLTPKHSSPTDNRLPLKMQVRRRSNAQTTVDVTALAPQQRGLFIRRMAYRTLQ